MNDPRGLKRFVLVVGIGSASLLTSCTFPHGASRGNDRSAFITYWPAKKEEGVLRLAVKDNIDVKGTVTTAGSEFLSKTGRPAKRDAECLAIARERGVKIVGKTVLSEFAISPSGSNDFFGTPLNPLDRRQPRLPGGSSSGSAVAVARGMADVAFGTDTAGSVRVPAASCGIVGLKTTHGLVSLKGVYPVEPKFLDTVGPMAKTVAGTVNGMDLLERGFAEQYATAVAAKPSGPAIRVGRLRLAGTASKIDTAVDGALAAARFQIVELGDDFLKKWEQAEKDANTMAAAAAWNSNRKYASKSGVSARSKTVFVVGRLSYPTGYREAITRQKAWERTLRSVFKKVDMIALPTLQSAPLVILPGLNLPIIEARVLGLQNTSAVNFGGNPALALPIPLRRGELPVTSLQLVGPKLSEAALLNAGRIVETAVKRWTMNFNRS